MSFSVCCCDFSRLVLFAALVICVAFVQTETAADSSPALQNDNQDTLSGAGAVELTTQDPIHELTENPNTSEYEDATPALTLHEEEGVLGPGAVTAVVIAGFLGASVLLSLLVITLRKFTAS